MLGYRMVKKLSRYIKPFSTDTRTLRTDGQTVSPVFSGKRKAKYGTNSHFTDRRTDRQICYINIARQYADAR